MQTAEAVSSTPPSPHEHRVRLRDSGDRIVGAFRGAPCPYQVVWLGARYQLYSPELHLNARPSLRVLFNLYVPAVQRMKVIECSARMYQAVLSAGYNFGLDDWLFEIERHGRPGAPKTRYTVVPFGRITPTLRAVIDATPLHDLESLINAWSCS